jgi:error-prone DNA polymerase
MGYYPARVLVAEARRSGAEILPVDINRSTGDYIVENGTIRVSLRQLRGMSEEAERSILGEREKGRFTSLRDFVLRTNVSRPITENLIRVGAFDSLGDRSELLAELTKLIELRHKTGNGVRPLFEDVKWEPLQVGKFANDDIKANMMVERELLSLNLSAHPLDFYALDEGVTRMRDLHSIPGGKAVKIAGSVIRYQTPPTRNGNRVVYVIMEDGTGVADVTVFGDVQEKCGEVLFREGWLTVRGKVQRRGPKALSIIAENLSPLNIASMLRK